MSKLTNRECGAEVAALRPFVSGNKTIEGCWTTDGSRYVVKSYGYYPIFVWDSDTRQWFETDNGYSNTTRRHMSYTRPTSNTRVVPHATLVTIAREGFAAAAINIVKGRNAA